MLLGIEGSPHTSNQTLVALMHQLCPVEGHKRFLHPFWGNTLRFFLQLEMRSRTWLICASPTCVALQKCPARCFLQTSGGLGGTGTSISIAQGGKKRQEKLHGFPEMQEQSSDFLLLVTTIPPFSLKGTNHVCSPSLHSVEVFNTASADKAVS